MFFLLSVFLITLSPFAAAANYQYDPELAAQFLADAGVSSTAADEVISYLDARDQAYANLKTLFSASAPLAYLVELEKREQVYQNFINGKTPRGLITKAISWPSPKPPPRASVVKQLEALSMKRHSAYASIFDQTGDPTTLEQMAIFDAGISGLVSLATVTGQPTLIQDYLAKRITSSAFVARLDAGAIPGLLEHTIGNRTIIEQTLLDEYETFAATLTATLGDGSRVYFDYLETLAQTLIHAAQSDSVHNLTGILSGGDFECDLAAALLTSGSAETYSSLFAYLGQRRNAYGTVLGELRNKTVTKKLFESIEYQVEAWEILAKADDSAIRDDPHLKSMDTTDHAVGTILFAVVSLGYSQFNPYPGMTIDEAFDAFNKDVEEVVAMVSEVDSSTSDETMEELKKRLREIKEIKEALEGFKVLLKEELSEEDYKKLCKYIRIGCVLLRAACDILEILCEDGADKELVPKDPLGPRVYGWPWGLAFNS